MRRKRDRCVMELKYELMISYEDGDADNFYLVYMGREGAFRMGTRASDIKVRGG